MFLSHVIGCKFGMTAYLLQTNKHAIAIMNRFSFILHRFISANSRCASLSLVLFLYIYAINLIFIFQRQKTMKRSNTYVRITPVKNKKRKFEIGEFEEQKGSFHRQSYITLVRVQRLPTNLSSELLSFLYAHYVQKNVFSFRQPRRDVVRNGIIRKE